jgi:hypothetical protein
MGAPVSAMGEPASAMGPAVSRRRHLLREVVTIVAPPEMWSCWARVSVLERDAQYSTRRHDWSWPAVSRSYSKTTTAPAARSLRTTRCQIRRNPYGSGPRWQWRHACVPVVVPLNMRARRVTRLCDTVRRIVIEKNPAARFPPNHSLGALTRREVIV